MPASAKVPNVAALLGIVLVWSIASTTVGAHESWINRGGYRNSAGEWCCGDNDCESPGQIAVTGKGWVIGGKEFVPSTRPRQVLTERSGSAAGPITRAVVYSDRRQVGSATALRQDQTNFSKIS
jgi:hypothetical protein